MSTRAAAIGACLLLSFTPDARAQALGGSAPIRVTGGERLAWEQDGPASLTPAGTYQFVLHVDGSPSVLEAVTCAPSSPSFLTCSTTLPLLAGGAHTLRLSTAVEGREGGLSEPMTVIAAPPSIASDRMGAPVSATRTSPTCAGDGSSCYDITELFATRQPIRLVTPAGGERVLFVEGDRSVRILDRGRLMPEAALVMDRPTDRVIAIGADPSFQDTRVVWAAWIDESMPGAPALTVARFREVNGVFGQRAVVVSELPVQGAGDPRVTWDAAGEILIALPSPLPGQAGDQYGGALLRLAPDGTTPRGSGQTSPVLTRGVDRPTAIAADSLLSGVWTAGDSGSGAHVTWYSVAAPDGIQVFNWGSRIVSLSAGADPGASLFIVDSAGDLYRVARSSHASAPERIALGDEEAIEVAAGAGGLYAVMRSDDGASSVFTLVRLTAR